MHGRYTVVDGIHVFHAFEYADATARGAAVSADFIAEDVGKVAWQLDNNSFWVLTDISPVTWSSIAASGTGGFAYQLVSASATLPDTNTIIEVDLDAGAAATLTLPVPTSGRMYLVRKISGGSTKTITVAPHTGTVEVDDVAGSRLLPGSNYFVDAASSGQPYAAWFVWSDGTNWRTMFASQAVIHTWGQSGAPDNTTHSVAVGYTPGSTWHNGETPGRLYIQGGSDTGDAYWHRVDGVDPISFAPSGTLPSRDTQAFVDTTGGVSSVTLPDPTGSNTGRQFSITKINTGTNKITLVRAGSEKINTVAASYDLPGSELGALGRWHVSSDGTDWWVF